MKQYFIKENTLIQIANAIRKKLNSDDTYTPLQMPDAIERISGVGDEDVYDGVYNITPTKSEQVLLTQDKLLQNNIIVQAIPLNKIENQSGGYTVNIGD